MASLLYLFISFAHTNSKVHTQTHKPDQTKININGFGMAKSAAQLLYGPVLVFIIFATYQSKVVKSGGGYN